MSDDGSTGGSGGDHASNGPDAEDDSDMAAIDEALRERFTWYVVAKKEFQDTIRSKLLVALSAIFVILFALPVFLGLFQGFGANIDQLTTDQFFQQRAAISAVLIPIISIVIGYASIVGERESGSLKVLLSLPFSRRDVVFGKVVGRSAVVAVPILIGFLVSVAILVPAGVQIKPLGFLLGSALTALLGVVFVALAVGFSAATDTSRRAIIATVGVYIYLFLFWNSFANSLGQLLREYANVSTASTLKLSLFLKLLNPTQAYKTLIDAALGQTAMTARAGIFSGMRSAAACQQALGGNFTFSRATGIACNPTNGGLPFYYSNAAVLVYLLLWLVVPVVLGYMVFDESDL